MAINLQFAHMNDANSFNSLSSDVVNFALAGDNVLISGIAGKKIYVFRLKWVVSGDTTITVKNGTGISLTGPMTYFAGGTDVFDISNVPWFQTTAGNDFILSSTNSVQVSGMLHYQQY